MQEENKQYEISLVLANEESYAGILDFIKTKAQVLTENPPRRTRLFYPINKTETGFFAWMIASALPEVIPNLQKDLEMNPEVLRVLIITPPLPSRTERKTLESKGEPKDKPKKEAARAAVKDIKEVKPDDTLTNEALEKKLEEILQ